MLMWRRTRNQRRARSLAVSLLILALLPTPWPKVEFHNVRHHDGTGQVCEYHDHLLRWHPDATSGEDVAVLHWHWAWPAQGTDDPSHGGAGPRLHAHLTPDAAPAAEPTPALRADAPARLLPPQTLAVEAAFAAAVPPPDPLMLRLGPPRALTFQGTFAPRTSLTARLHRWSC